MSQRFRAQNSRTESYCEKSCTRKPRGIMWNDPPISTLSSPRFENGQPSLFPSRDFTSMVVPSMAVIMSPGCRAPEKHSAVGKVSLWGWKSTCKIGTTNDSNDTIVSFCHLYPFVKKERNDKLIVKKNIICLPHCLCLGFHSPCSRKWQSRNALRHPPIFLEITVGSHMPLCSLYPTNHVEATLSYLSEISNISTFP